jgi:subtilase family serine protease
MRRPLLAALVSAAALALTTIALAPSAGADPSPTGQANRNVPVCLAPGNGSASCDAIRRDEVDAHGKTVPTAATAPVPGSLGPKDIQSAYNLTGLKSSGRTVAIVDAYDDPTAEKDLGVYRSQYGMTTACTTDNGCFTKVGQAGTSALPSPDRGWGQEISLDLDMVTATCPDCHILLVETNSSSLADLNAGVAYAAGLKDAAGNPVVAAISNSYGGSDTNGANYKAYQNAANAGIAVTASTGDSGYGDQSPASFPGVVAVGGTSLKHAATTRGWTETAWTGAGSGCSRYNAKPSYQDPALTKCSNKANADVSAVADPNTGVAVYDSTPDSSGNVGWMQFGGTSASSPIIAGVYALSGNTANAGSLPWTAYAKKTGGLYDVTSGLNGHCATRVWCSAGSGWDGPTGVGTPNGTSAF